MLEPLEGTGTLTFDRTGEKWTVPYNLAHATQIFGSQGRPKVAKGERVIIAPNPPVSFGNGEYTLEAADGEFVFLQHLDGKWQTRG